MVITELVRPGRHILTLILWKDLSHNKELEKAVTSVPLFRPEVI